MNAAAAAQTEEAPSANKAQYLKKKQQNKELKKIENQIEKSEEDIAKLETEISKLDEILTDPAKYKDAVADPAVFSRYQELQQKLEKEMKVWENLNQELEDAQSSLE